MAAFRNEVAGYNSIRHGQMGDIEWCHGVKPQSFSPKGLNIFELLFQSSVPAKLYLVSHWTIRSKKNLIIHRAKFSIWFGLWSLLLKAMALPLSPYLWYKRRLCPQPPFSPHSSIILFSHPLSDHDACWWCSKPLLPSSDVHLSRRLSDMRGSQMERMHVGKQAK